MSSSATENDAGPPLDVDGSSTPAKGVPPLENPSSLWTRRLILIAFWAVVATLGLPHWIWTTSIHRSNLPLDSMNSWANGDACQLHYPLYIRLKHSDGDNSHASDLAKQVEGLLNSQNKLSLYEFYVITDGANNSSASNVGQDASTVDSLLTNQHEDSLFVNVQADAKAKSTQAVLRSWERMLDIQHNPSRSVDSATLAPFITREISEIFSGEQERLSYLLKDSRSAKGANGNHLSPETKMALDARTTRAFKYAPTYHLTFSMFTSSASPSTWDIEKAYEDYVHPLVSRLSSISAFTIDTQVQLYASFSPSIAGPQYDSSSREWKLQKSDLSGFINAAEWPLNPSIGSGPTINFVLYVPSREQTPLVLAETGGNSWLIPQWGGVQILNPTAKQSEILTADDLRPVMLTFADQLSSLLGLPQQPPSLSMRISALTRERATSLILSTSSTLGALARLTLKLTSIEIPDSVAKSVDTAILKLDHACQDVQEGRYDSALDNARIAEAEAEQAFFEPSMVGQVYFPDEHKVAVYVPLLGPMAVPLVLAILKELKSLREKKRKTE